MRDPREVIVRPVVTEGSAILQEAERTYTFIVAKDANKIEIRKAIEAFYPQVKVAEVRTLVVRGKTRRQMTKRGAVAVRRAGYKKAIATLPADPEPINSYAQA